MSPLASRSILLTIALTVTLFAGCISEPEPVTEPNVSSTDDVAARLLDDWSGLPCEPGNYERGQTSPNFLQITHMENPDARYGEAEAIDGTDLAVFARYGGGGFDIYNVSNPYDPEHVVGFPLESYSLDVKVTADGKTLLSGDFGRFEVVDISDPYNPVSQGFVNYPTEATLTQAQAHMIHIAEIDGETYVFTASQWGQGVLIFHMAGEPDAREFHFLGYFAPAIGGPLAAHDMMVYHDPVDDKPILWVANGFGGFVAADVSDPGLPVLVSYSPEPDPHQGYTHTVSVTHYDEKRYAVTMAEIGLMALKIWDVTVMAAPVLLGSWAVDGTGMSTQHNTQILGDWLWMGHYGEGVIKFNLTDVIDNQLTLPAYNIQPLAPVLGAIEPFGQYKPETGSTWESIVINGVHWTTAGGGIYGTLDGCMDPTDTTLDAYV